MPLVLSDYAFAVKQLLQKHIDTVHEDKRPCLCSDCGKGIYKHSLLIALKKFLFSDFQLNKRMSKRQKLSSHCYYTKSNPNRIGAANSTFQAS